MTPELAAFSDWTLALLPRLFLYPGGLWLLAALLLFRSASGGLPAVQPSRLLHDLARVNLLSAALAWTAIALLPFPGIPPLPYPVDRFVPLALLALSFLLDIKGGKASPLQGVVTAIVTLAVLIPSIESRTLFGTSAHPTIAVVASSLAVGIALVALLQAGEGQQSISGGVRWLSWLCLGLLPLWQFIAVEGAWLPSLTVVVALLLLCGLSRLLPDGGRAAVWAASSALFLALLGLLPALLASV
ncbi:MAG: hypothetical protein ABI670_09855 [Chloroflexota bacterium]